MARVERCASILPVVGAPAALKGRRCELWRPLKGTHRHRATCDWCDGAGEEDNGSDCGVCKGDGYFQWTDEEALDGR